MRDGARGTLALAGSGEFLPAMAPIDSLLLNQLGEPGRVVVLPTASAPDGPGVAERWASMGVEHFAALGASVDPVMLLTRADAERAALAARIAAANFVYLSGGKPRYLLDTLRTTLCWQAIERVFTSGGIVAGCSAGAMVLGAQLIDVPLLWRTTPALNLASGIVVMPHFDEIPRWVGGLAGRLASSITLVGIDGSTALVGRDGDWKAIGMGRVTVMRPHGRTEYRAGASVPL
ncbi:MAG TPA: Type 1 glutamine amidotransferase-like domain-containing protein [Ktedonobacterales bacterium]|nr:Type 1 glutamine amidotransferase-like domain-containing protein [Ktedonobacterales bacterium]